MEKEHYSIKEAAKIMGVNPATIRRRIKSGELHAVLKEGVYGNQYLIPAKQIDPCTKALVYTDVIQTTRQVSVAEIEGLLSHIINKAIQPLQDEISQLRNELEAYKQQNIIKKTKSFWHKLFKI